MIYSANDFKNMRETRKTKKDNNLKKIKRNFIFSSILIFFVFISGFMIITYADANNIVIVNYTINSGDTLWGIAEEFHTENKDIREFIYNIKKINSLENGLIYPGQTIRIPIYEKYK